MTITWPLSWQQLDMHRGDLEDSEGMEDWQEDIRVRVQSLFLRTRSQLMSVSFCFRCPWGITKNNFSPVVNLRLFFLCLFVLDSFFI